MDNQMDTRTKIVERLIDEKGHSVKSFAREIDIPYTTLRSILKRGIGNSSVDNVIKICKGLGITTEQLQNMAEGDDDANMTIAAHYDGDWTEEELKQLENFKNYLKSQRS